MKSEAMERGSDRRRDPRIEVPAAYTAVQVRRPGRRGVMRGHVLDVSAGGIAFEVDSPLVVGEPIEVRMELVSGGAVRPISAAGKVVRRIGPDEPGPARMAMAFADDQRERISGELSLES